MESRWDSEYEGRVATIDDVTHLTQRRRWTISVGTINLYHNRSYAMPDDIWKWIGEHKDQIMALCAIVTTICANSLAIYGVNKWRTEVLGKARLQAAQDVLRALYRVREAFKHVRQPAIYMYEYPPDMADGLGHLKNENRAEGTRHVYAKRFEKLDEAGVQDARKPTHRGTSAPW